MSPRMFSLIWTAFAVVAAILWLGGVFSMLVGVVFGFIAFGLVFTGMICVLPGTVSHPAPVKTKPRSEKTLNSPATATLRSA